MFANRALPDNSHFGQFNVKFWEITENKSHFLVFIWFFTLIQPVLLIRDGPAPCQQGLVKGTCSISSLTNSL
jgi:hypothetical protein